MTVWLLPIEPFNERYTSDWRRWWPADLASCGLRVQVLDGASNVGERSGGEWLDPVATWEWKGTQVAELARHWHAVRDGDVVLSLDGWGPATTAALYMRATTGRKVRIAIYLHAGAFDPHDYLARTGCSQWALHVERGWVHGVDLVLVGSEHAADLVRRHLWPGAPLAVVGVPVKQGELIKYSLPWEQRERLVVFPHRLAPEKGVHEWEQLVAAYRLRFPADNAVFIRSRDVYTDKASLYRLLGSARAVVSFARQETFGIVMQEGAALGAHPLAPRRLSYPEVMRGAGLLFDSLAEAVEQLHQLLNRNTSAPWDGYHEQAVHRAAHVIVERNE